MIVGQVDPGPRSSAVVKRDRPAMSLSRLGQLLVFRDALGSKLLFPFGGAYANRDRYPTGPIDHTRQFVGVKLSSWPHAPRRPDAHRYAEPHVRTRRRAELA